MNWIELKWLQNNRDPESGISILLTSSQYIFFSNWNLGNGRINIIKNVLNRAYLSLQDLSYSVITLVVDAFDQGREGFSSRKSTFCLFGYDRSWKFWLIQPNSILQCIFFSVICHLHSMTSAECRDVVKFSNSGEICPHWLE